MDESAYLNVHLNKHFVTGENSCLFVGIAGVKSGHLTNQRNDVVDEDMARPLRIEYEGAFYHVMNRGLERREILQEERDYEKFLELLEDTHQQYHFKE